MQISIVIPNFNGKDLLMANLPLVMKYAPQTEIIVVYDGSTDKSVEFLKNNFPQIKVLEKVTNSGFSVSVNLGVKAARSEIIVLLNTDVLPQTDFIGQIQSSFLNPRVFAVGFMDVSREGNVTVKRGRGIGNFSRGLFLHARGEVDKQNTLWASGGSSAFRKSIWEHLHGFDEIYKPFYWEDIDLSYRALKSGYEIVFNPQIQVIHSHQQGSIKIHYSESYVEILSYRNQFIFIWKNITDISCVFKHIVWTPFHLCKALLSGNMNMIKGFFRAILLIPQIYKKRKNQTKLYTSSDSVLLSQFT